MSIPDLHLDRSLDDLLTTARHRGRVLRQRRRRARLAARLGLGAVPLLLLVGTWAAANSDGNRDRVTAAAPSSDQEYEVDAVVLENEAHGPQLCLGGINLSDPPQCQGLPVTNWDWDAAPGRRSKVGTTWASVHLRGRYDGTRFILTAPPAPAGPAPAPAAPDFSPACADPEVLDPIAGGAEWEEATQRFGHLPDLVAAWVSNAGPGEGPFVANLVVRPEARAETRATVRRYYGGPLCLVERDQRTSEELGAIQAAVVRRLGNDVLEGAPDYRRGVVVVTVVLATPELQAAMDDEFGKGVVELRSRLTPVT